MIPDFTIVVAIDPAHLAELRLSYPTWIRHHPELADRPMVVICDGDRHPDGAPARPGATVAWWGAIEDIVYPFHRGKIHPIFASSSDPQISQREKMLSAFVLKAPLRVDTPWYLKIDTDCIATVGGDWVYPEWFEREPVLIAPAWGYTKPGSMLDKLDDWADCNPELVLRPPPARRAVGQIAKHRRIISYCMFGRTDWTRNIAKLCGDRLPVPSQDTFLWYCAERLGHLWMPAKMNGWRHVGGGGQRLRIAAQEAMKTEGVTA